MRAGQLKWAEIGQARSRLMRRLRAGLVTSRPGRLGQPSAPTTWGCLRWLDAVRMNGGGSRRDQGAHRGLVSTRKHGPKARNRRRWSAERRAWSCCFSQKRKTRAAPRKRSHFDCAFRRSAPSLSREGRPAKAGLCRARICCPRDHGIQAHQSRVYPRLAICICQIG